MIAKTETPPRLLHKTCKALEVSRATVYRRRRPRAKILGAGSRPSPHRKLSLLEETDTLQILHSPRFMDVAPGEIYATLLDEGQYRCSERTMYRILAKHGEVRERRDQLRHPKHPMPELVATGPNQVWTWDITKLEGPARGVYYFLYVILDIYSRYAVGWMLAESESAAHARVLFTDTLSKYPIARDTLKTHSDRGAPMTSHTLAELFVDLGVLQSFSRPRVSNDNCYSEAQFKTVKYSSGYPQRFGSPEHARAWCHDFFDWYHHRHRHSGIGWMTPASFHFGGAEQIHQGRARTLAAAFAKTPERFVNKPPRPPRVFTWAAINVPAPRNKPELVLH